VALDVKYKFYNPQGDFYTELFSDIKSLEKIKKPGIGVLLRLKDLLPRKIQENGSVKYMLTTTLLKR